MPEANINIKIDAALKQEAETLFNDLGLNMSSAISIFLRSAVNNDGFPFEIKRPVPNEETKAALGEYEEMKSDFVKYKRYSSFDEALNEVLSDA